MMVLALLMVGLLIGCRLGWSSRTRGLGMVVLMAVAAVAALIWLHVPLGV